MDVFKYILTSKYYCTIHISIIIIILPVPWYYQSTAFEMYP